MTAAAAEPESTRIGVLLSGRGSNFLALQGAIERGELPAEIALVVSNRRAAAGLVEAHKRGLPTAYLPRGHFDSRESHDAAIVERLRAARVQWVVLAGYMRLLSAGFVSAFPNRILNIHPSLLPAFPGLDVQQAALDYGVKVSGCTVHLVDEELDHGPIVEQRPVPVEEGDDAPLLAERILVQEHRAYSSALRKLLTRRWRIEGRRVVFEDDAG